MVKLFDDIYAINVIKESKARLDESLAFCLQNAKSLLSPQSFRQLQKICKTIASIPNPSGFAYALNDRFLSYLEDTNFQNQGESFIEKAFLDLSHLHLQSSLETPLGFEELRSLEQNIVLTTLINQLPNPRPIQSLDVDTFNQSTFLLNKAWEILKVSHPQAYQEARRLARLIIFLNVEGFLSGSNFETLGNLYLRDALERKTIADYIEAIIHETGHVLIFSLTIEDELVLNSNEEVYPSPLRQDPRPMMGIFHTFFVAARNILIFDNLLKLNLPELIPERIRLQELFSLFTKAYQEGREVITKQGRLTDKGRQIFRSCQDQIAPILSTYEQGSQNTFPSLNA